MSESSGFLKEIPNYTKRFIVHPFLLGGILGALAAQATFVYWARPMLIKKIEKMNSRYTSRVPLRDHAVIPKKID